MPFRVVDGLKVIHVEDGEREAEAARIGECGVFCNAVRELMAVVRAREEVALRLVLRLLQLARERGVLPGEVRIPLHLLADQEEDERDGRVDGIDGGREHRREQMIFPVQGVDADKDGEREHRDHAVAAGGVFLPGRAQERIEEDEAADEEERIEEIEQVHVAVEARDLADRRRGEEEEIDDHRAADRLGELRCGNLLRDLCECDGHDVEHDEVQFPPEAGLSEDAREEGRCPGRPQDEAHEKGDEIELPLALPPNAAPCEIHDEKDDQRERD